MGNHAKRRQVALRLKELGLGKLYRGSKVAARKRLSTRTLDDLWRFLCLEPGDVVQDCDGFNHVFKELLPLRFHHSRWASRELGIASVRGWVFHVDQCVFEDGQRSCGCSPPCLPESREDIEAGMSTFLNDPAHVGWDSPLNEELRKRLNTGEFICDEQGLLLEELRKLQSGVLLEKVRDDYEG